jgi:thiol:disulfide interchange protein/DsbC/DsbD-like thiol-disulfide interchange protein
MKLWLRTCLILGLLLTTTSSWAAGKTQASLLLGASGAKPGDTVWAGLRFVIPPHWHIYWRNPGTTGIATQIEWVDLPAGVTAGPIHWPVPERRITRVGESEDVSYDYEGELVLLVPLQIGAEATVGEKTLKARVTWLECETNGSCIPGSAETTATLNIAGSTIASADAPVLEEWRQRLPATSPAPGARAFWDGAPSDDPRAYVVEWRNAGAASSPDFFPFESEGMSFLSGVQVLPATDGVLRLRKKVTKFDGDWPKSLGGLLVGNAGAHPPAPAIEAVMELEVAGEDVAAVASAKDAGASAVPTAVARPEKSFGLMLLYALLGGLILNVMPCVLPVIALKVLGFVNQAEQDPKRVLYMGVVYTLGVLASFLLLAGIVIALKQAGQAAGWGFQFANPKFLVVMTVLITLVALNLFGLFEVGLGGGAMNAAGELSAKEGPAGAFFQGVLATALATACVGPFLAIAIGYALSPQMPATATLLFFLTIGFGLALPYLLLSWKPAGLKFLPRPGPWMGHFKVAMGFPMLATVAWLLWNAEEHYGGDGVLWIGLFLVILACAAWVWGEFVQRGAKRIATARTVALALIVGGYAYTLEAKLHWRHVSEPVLAAGPVPATNELPAPLTADGSKVAWQPWSPELIVRARAAGRPVLVDFTAKWCLTCNVNKATSIEIPDVRTKLKELNVLPLIGDYTRQPAHMTDELQKFGRAGVPLVLVYPKNPSREPLVLPEVLTPSIVQDALDKAVN